MPVEWDQFEPVTTTAEPDWTQFEPVPENQPPIVLSPYDKATLAGGERVSGPFGPANPQEVLNLPQVLKVPASIIAQSGIPESMEEVGANFLNRTGLNPSAQPGVPLAPTREQQTYIPSSFEQAFPNVGKGIEETLRGFTTPGQALIAPFVGLKPVQTAFEAQMTAGIPESVEELSKARTPEDITKGILQTAIGLGAGRKLSKSKPSEEFEVVQPPPEPSVTTDVTNTPKPPEIAPDTSGGVQTPPEPSEQPTVAPESATGTPVTSPEPKVPPTSQGEPTLPKVGEPPVAGVVGQGEVGPGTIGDAEMGAAGIRELNDIGEGADIYGIAQRIREQRAKAGQTVITEPGQGVSPVEAVIHGQDVLEKDPNAAQTAADAFSKDKSISYDGLTAVRAAGEKAFSEARKIEEKLGTDSPEYKSAKSEEEKWNRVSKEMQTEWHKTGQAQQGQTDIDTGSFTGLERARMESSDKNFTPYEAKTAKAVADRSKKATTELETAKDDLVNHIVSKTKGVDARVKSIADRIISTMDKAGEDALARIRARRQSGAAFSGVPIDPTVLDDYVIYGASKIAKGAVEFGVWSAEMIKDLGDYIKPELDKIWDRANKKTDDFVSRNSPGPLLEKVKSTVRKGPDAERAAFDAAKKTVREAAVSMSQAVTKARVAKTVREQEVAKVQLDAAKKALDSAREVVKSAAETAAKKAQESVPDAVLKEQEKAARKALESAQKVSRDAAARLAKSEAGEGAVNASKAKEVADVQEKAAQKALDAVQKRARESAAKAAENERKLQADPILKVWNAVKGYIDKGETNPAEIFRKVASDLGMSEDRVYRTLSQDATTKRLTDEMWKKAQAARIIKENAKRWVQTLDNPDFEKYLALIPQSMFKAKVFGHAAVALGTHAPVVGWQLRYWPMFAKNYYKMWKLALSPATYERMTTELQNRKNYVPAQRYGLKNRFSEHDEINAPMVLSWMKQNKIGLGTRGYSILKFLRQDLFDGIWDKLPKTSRTDEMGWIIANRVNHLTGTLSDVQPPKSLGIKGDIKLPSGASTIGFAPTLLVSRARVIFKDPAQSAAILTRWNKASEAQKMAVKMDVSDRLWATGTMLALLGINAGMLYSANSKQKINFTDPTRSDWLKFKGFGMDFAFGNAMISMGRFLPRLGVQISEQGSDKRKRTYADEQASDAVWQFTRSQLSPYAGTILDLGLGADFQKRPLPRKLFGLEKQTQPVPLRLRKEGVKPYSWGEYGMQTMSPIPFQEAQKEIWKSGLGMSDEQIKAYTKAIATSLIMGSTGGRISEDLAKPMK